MVRGYYSCVSEREVASATVHAHARGTRAFLRFLKEEGYISPPIHITIKMPRVEQKKMRVLSADELVVEIEQKLSWVEKVVTKWAISGTSARNLTPKVAQAKIGSTAKASLKNLESKEIFALPSPIRFEVDFKSPRYAYLLADIPGIERESGVSVRFTGSGMIEISGIWKLMLNACMSQLPV